ncbi:MAG: YchJ family metal-binding protein [Ancrocorticia sp.]
MPSIAPLPNDVVFCPCQSGKAYGICCGPYHNGENAPNAEALMRSRYSAYALRNEDYVLETWHPGYRPDTVGLEAQVQWRRLDILDFSEHENRAVVEFRAHWRKMMERGIMHERSSFICEGGRWYYTNGIQL